jgi:hypothetical protein
MAPKLKFKHQPDSKGHSANPTDVSFHKIVLSKVPIAQFV